MEEVAVPHARYERREKLHKLLWNNSGKACTGF